MPQGNSDRQKDSAVADSSGSSPLRLSTEATDLLERLSFRHPFRKYQQEIIELVKLKLEKGEKQFHIVAPPGAGKTIIGLQLVAQLKQPSLIVCPTTTIQSQWGQKLDLFIPPELEGYALPNVIGTHEDNPLKPITLLTYQVLTTPGREQEHLQRLAHDAWVQEICKGSPISQGEAELRVVELMQNNRKAYDKEMSRHISRLRRKLTDLIDLKEVLHANAFKLLQLLRRQKFKVVIFDECHHLTDYWAAVMTHVVSQLDDPIIIGLTGTPPEGKSASQENRYLSLVGDIDYQVPTPALVREGGLAPFQDLVMFTQPTEKEENFLAEQHEEFHALVEQLVVAEPPLLVQWVRQRLDEAAVAPRDSYLTKRTHLAAAMVRFAWKYKLPLPAGIELSSQLRQSPLIDDWMEILEDFALNHLKVSSNKEDHQLYDRIRSAIAKLGFGLTERGLRKQASPVDRILAFSQSKPRAVAQILDSEYRNLGDRLRGAIVTDFEKMSALSVKSAKGVLSQESGGAVGVVRQLLGEEIGALVNPCMVTGSLLLVDTRIANQFVEAAQEYLRCEGHYFQLKIKERFCTTAGAGDSADNSEEDGDTDSFRESDVDADANLANTSAKIAESTPDYDWYNFIDPGKPKSSLKDDREEPKIPEPFVEITASSSEWQPRLYVGMATALLERGITKCLIGTRGIFGEGWDCQSLNTLIDLTTTTTPVSVKQLRGRSIRLNVQDPLGARKVANNWDVVCIAPQLEKGLNDYQRFVRKHDGYFGISDDGQIECGVGHVHPSFSELTPAEVFANHHEFNQEMIDRALVRDQIYDLWKVGVPYHNKLLGCIEVSGLRKLALTPPNIRRNLDYKGHAALMRSSLNGLWLEYGGLGSAMCGLLALLLAHFSMPVFLAVVPMIPIMYLGRKKYVALFERLKSDTCRPNTRESSLMDMAICVLSALQQTKLLPRYIEKESLQVTVRSDGSYRIFLDDVEPEQSEYFAKSMRELLAPVTNQPYLIPKYEFYFPRDDNGQNKDASLELAPESHESYVSEHAFFSAYLKGKAQPRISAYHPLPSLLARSEKGREAFEACWNKYVSPGCIQCTEEKPELLNKYFGIGPSLAQRLLWE